MLQLHVVYCSILHSAVILYFMLFISYCPSDICQMLSVSQLTLQLFAIITNTFYPWDQSDSRDICLQKMIYIKLLTKFVSSTVFIEYIRKQPLMMKLISKLTCTLAPPSVQTFKLDLMYLEKFSYKMFNLIY